MAVSACVVPQEPADDSPAGRVLQIVADGLNGHGFDVWDRTLGASQHFVITNVRGAVCEAAFTTDGRMTWEYTPCHGTYVDPAHIVDMVVAILGADPSGRAAPALHRGLTLKGVVGRTLAELGLRVDLTVVHQDDVNYDVYGEIEVTNPGRPETGKVWVSDHGVVRWECSVSCPSTAGGFSATDIAQTIASMLAGQST